jgi:hypothetical protein
MHFTGAIGELEPGIAGEAIGPVGRRVNIEDVAPLVYQSQRPPAEYAPCR